MTRNLLELYEQCYFKLILKFLEGVVGQRAAVLTADSLYQKTVIDPAWNFLPLPLRMMGRKKVRWDDFFGELRQEFFVTKGGTLTLPPHAETRLRALAYRIFPPPRRSAKDEKVGDALAPNKPASRPPEAAPAKKTLGKPAPEPPEITVGIDLGTTFSVIAQVDANGRPISIPNAVGEVITPSVILLEEAGPVVGREAVLAAAMEPEKIAECVKRDIGSKFHRKKVNGEFLPPEVLSSLILKSLKADAERKLGPIRKAVITVPAYFDENRRRATMDAGRLAGLEVLDIITVCRDGSRFVGLGRARQAGMSAPPLNLHAILRPLRYYSTAVIREASRER